MTANVVDLSIHKRRLGMIATSGSWRRHWLAWRWRKYPLVRCQVDGAATAHADYPLPM